VDSHVLFVCLPYKVLIALPEQLCNVVPFTYIGYKFNHSVVGCVFDCIRRIAVRRDLDCHSAVIVCATGRAPTPVAFIHIQADAAIVTDGVVAGRGSVCVGEVIATRLCRPLRRHAVDCNRVNGGVPWAVFLCLCDIGICCQAAIVHSFFSSALTLLSSVAMRSIS